jgi:sodium-dependent phosphate cotransporter
LEYYFHAISTPAAWLAGGLKKLPGQSFIANLHLSDYTIKPLAGLFSGVVLSLPWIILLAAAVLLIVSLLSFTQLLKGVLLSKAENSFEKNFFKNPFRTVVWGAGITAAIQSSTVSTSISTLLVAADKVSPRRIYPFILGANLGTTITGILASFSRPEIALALAMAHVLFNFTGILLFFPYGQLRGWPLWAGRELAQLCTNHRAVALFYVLLVFYILPFLIIFLIERSTF